jgi:hypothetical protein
MNIVDRIGSLKAQIAPLEKQLKKLEAELKAQGPGRYEGVNYDATISAYVMSRLDMDAVRAKLSAQFIRSHTIESDVVKITVSARLPAIAA